MVRRYACLKITVIVMSDDKNVINLPATGIQNKKFILLSKNTVTLMS